MITKFERDAHALNNKEGIGQLESRRLQKPEALLGAWPKGPVVPRPASSPDPK